MTLVLTNLCNLSCKYCYVAQGKITSMSEKILLSSISWFIHSLMQCDEKEGGLIFFGGEPLLELDLIKKAISYSKTIIDEFGIELKCSIVTNGTLLKPEVVKYFIDNEVRVQVSIDGAPDSHNLNRQFVDGQPSYRQMNYTENLKEYISQGLKIAANMVYTDSTIGNLYNNVQHLKAAGFQKIRLRPVIGTMDSWNEEVIKKEFNKIFKELQTKPDIKIYPFSEYDEEVKRVNTLVDYSQINSEVPCMICRNNYCVDQEGGLFPCHRFCFLGENGKFHFGNIDGSINYRKIDDFLSNRPRVTGRCAKCPYKYYCDNQCMAVFYQKNGSLTEPDLALCSLSKVVWKTFISFKAGELDETIC